MDIWFREDEFIILFACHFKDECCVIIQIDSRRLFITLIQAQRFIFHNFKNTDSSIGIAFKKIVQF